MKCRFARGGASRVRPPSFAAALLALVAVAALLVPLLSQKAYAGAPPTLSYSGSTITCQYSNNVAAGRVFSSNASAWAVGPDGATISLGVWRNYYGDGSPDAANPDTYGERRRLYIDTSPLLPGTTYTVTKGAAVSLGGDSYPAASITITTPGTPPTPPEPEPEPEPDPVEPPAGGGGGSQGNDGSDSAGDGADQGVPDDSSEGSSSGGDDPSEPQDDAASTDEDVAASADEDDGGSPADGAAPGASSDSRGDASNADGLSRSRSDASDDSIASTASGESRAAGIGGGTVYLVGEAGADPGEIEDPEEPSVTIFAIAGLAIVAVAAGAAGATKRFVLWKRHLSNGGRS